ASTTGGGHTLMGRFVSATGQFLLATYGQFSCPPTGSFSCPLTLAVKPWFPRLSAIGSLMAIGMFATTLTFVLSTPGAFEASAGGFPVLSSTGQFLIKDVALLGISAWTLVDALTRR
ncbi:YkgB family protein, partial [Mycobacterium gordonae]|uniref:DUF417 family protein n=1 Tax=Mycobacterium gordonae TaxID=1778 RepID=UPI00210BBC52